MSGRALGLGCAVAAFAFDQGTKALALRSATLAESVEVLPILNLVLVRNRGISFGMLGGVMPWWALTVVSLAIVAVLAAWLWRAQSRVLSVALGLVIGGALSNVLDRVRHGAVTDFLDFHFATHHWPAFNLADMAIVAGAALLLLDGLRGQKREAAITTQST
ncbi:signal peptidase II [Paracoccus aeridis]|uniref:signal peptidase II n=1 Tax=Paracoccus aeridis TaxID=1966466 RepID=UPI0010A9F87E|nr:signal peptidase II [Paracoccus aeridis]